MKIELTKAELVEAIFQCQTSICASCALYGFCPGRGRDADGMNDVIQFWQKNTEVIDE